MANEFKVKKGLIVEGSGSAVLDIQGSQGQLFSVTDDLTGDIFSVSDISGVPILNVNADGTTTIDGTLTLTNDEVLDSTSDTSIKFLTRDSNGVVKYHTLGSNAFNSTAFTTNTGTLTGNGTSTYIPFYNGTTSFSTTNKLTWDGTYLLTMGLKIIGTAAQNSEATSLMINSSGIVGTRELGSNAFNSTAFTTNTGTLTGNGTSGRIPIYNGTTSFTTDSGFTYSSNKLSIDGTLRSNGVDIISNATAGNTLIIGDVTEGDTITSMQFKVFADTMIGIDDDYVSIVSPKLTSLSAQNSEATALMINGSSIVGTRELGSNAFNSTSIPSLSGNVTIGGDLTVSGNQIITAGTNADVKFSVWTGSSYGIGMTSGVTYGHLNDYAMTFCMNNESDRGFWWGYSGQTKSDGAMSLTTAGKLKVKSTIEAQEITAVDTILGRDSQFQRMVTFVTEPEDSESTKALVWEATDAPLKIRNIPTNNNQLTNGAGFTTNTGTLTGNGSTNRVPFYSGTTTLTTDSSFTYTASSDGLTVGKISYGAGSATAPSVYFGGQSNTGLYWTYSPESMYVTVNGSTKAQWYSNGYKVVAGALGVNVNPSGTDGRIDASNDIVAYSSDKRLKENIKPIKNALDKVQSLSGFTYNWNEKAEEVAGFDRDESLVGVFAQDVQSILPEAVKPAPFDNDGKNNSISGENYLTVQYDKLTPLLIESIKELKAEIEELKKCKCKCNKGEI